MLETLLLQINNNLGISGMTIALILIAMVKWRKEILIAWSKLSAFIEKNTGRFSPRAILISKINYWINFKIKNLVLKDVGRTQLFKDILYVYFDTFKNHAFDIETAPDFNKINRQELYDRVVLCLNSIGNEFEISAEKYGIPEIVIKKFIQWHDRSLDFVLKSAELVTQSPIYKNNSEVMCALYLLYTASLEMTIVEAESALNSLNGEITGLTYKNTIIGE